MDGPIRQRPRKAGTGKTLGSGTFRPKFTTPPSFWRGWNGPASMAPPIHRKPPKPANTFWRPEVRR